AAPQFDGYWVTQDMDKVTIRGKEISWPDGTIWIMRTFDSHMFTVVDDGETYTAQLVSAGDALQWTDGDSWILDAALSPKVRREDTSEQTEAPLPSRDGSGEQPEVRGVGEQVADLQSGKFDPAFVESVRSLLKARSDKLQRSGAIGSTDVPMRASVLAGAEAFLALAEKKEEMAARKSVVASAEHFMKWSATDEGLKAMRPTGDNGVTIVQRRPSVQEQAEHLEGAVHAFMSWALPVEPATQEQGEGGKATLAPAAQPFQQSQMSSMPVVSVAPPVVLADLEQDEGGETSPEADELRESPRKSHGLSRRSSQSSQWGGSGASVTSSQWRFFQETSDSHLVASVRDYIKAEETQRRSIRAEEARSTPKGIVDGANRSRDSVVRLEGARAFLALADCESEDDARTKGAGGETLASARRFVEWVATEQGVQEVYVNRMGFRGPAVRQQTRESFEGAAHAFLEWAAEMEDTMAAEGLSPSGKGAEAADENVEEALKELMAPAVQSFEQSRMSSPTVMTMAPRVIAVQEQPHPEPAVQVAKLADALKGFLKLSSGEQGEQITDVDGRPLDGDSALAKGAHALLSLFEGEASEAKPDSEKVLAAGAFLSWATQGEAKVLKGGSPITVCGEETGFSLTDAARAFAEWAADKSSDKPVFAESLALAMETAAEEQRRLEEQKSAKPAQVVNLADALKGFLKLSRGEQGEEVTDVDGRPLDGDSALAKGAHALLSLFEGEASEAKPDSENVLAAGAFLSWATQGEAKVLKGGSPIIVCGEETGFSLTDAARAFAEWAADKSSDKPVFAESLALAMETAAEEQRRLEEQKSAKPAQVAKLADALKGFLKLSSGEQGEEVTDVDGRPLDGDSEEVTDVDGRPLDGDSALAKGAHALLSLFEGEASEAKPDSENVIAAGSFLVWATQGEAKVLKGGSPITVCGEETGFSLTDAARAFAEWAADKSSEKPAFAESLALAMETAAEEQRRLEEQKSAKPVQVANLADALKGFLKLSSGEQGENVIAAGSFLYWATQDEAKVLKGGSPITVCGEETGCNLCDAARAFAEWAADKCPEGLPEAVQWRARRGGHRRRRRPSGRRQCFGEGSARVVVAVRGRGGHRGKA
ncbi:unnamed protein product, partial [Prorocentrum cordatum]